MKFMFAYVIPSLFVLAAMMVSNADAQRVIRGRAVVVQGVPTPIIKDQEVCLEEKAAWQEADNNLNQSIVKKNTSQSAVEAAKDAVDAAKAALAAAEADYAAKEEEYQQACDAVILASTAATDAYSAYVDCRVGRTEPEPEPK